MATTKILDYYGEQIFLDPTSHAASTNIYGTGNATNYGHLKLSDSIDSSSVDVNGAIAATPKAVYESRKTSNAIGTLAVSHGGTGASSLTSNAVMTGNGTDAVKMVSSKSGALYSTGNGVAPAFGTLPIAQGGTGATALTTTIGPTSGSGAATNTQVPSALAVRNAINSGTANPNVSNATGTLPVSHGGTGATTITNNSVVTGNGTGAIKTVSTANGAFYATSANAAPAFGTLPVGQGGTGRTSLTSGQALIGNGGSAVNTREIKSTLDGSATGLADTSLATIGAVSTHASKAASQTVSGHVKVYVSGTTLYITGASSI